MDKVKIFKESKDHLLKINKIYEQTLKTGKMSKLDFDLLIDHVRDMYECLLQFDTPTHSLQENHDTKTPEILPSKNYPVQEELPQNQLTQDDLPEAIYSKSYEQPIEPAPTADIDEIETPEPELVVEPEPELPEPVTSTLEITPKAEPVSAMQSIIQSLHDDDTSTTPAPPPHLHSSDHVYKKDLFKMIGFNEKYIFLSELFASNQNQYQLTMQDLNNMPTFEACLQRIEQHWKPTLHWQDENEGYQYLIKLVELKYL